jgi:hypothetical protein
MIFLLAMIPVMGSAVCLARLFVSWASTPFSVDSHRRDLASLNSIQLIDYESAQPQPNAGRHLLPKAGA